MKSIKYHCKQNHEWKAKDGIRWCETQAQTFYLGNGQPYDLILYMTNGRYFAVREPDALPVTNFTEQLLKDLLIQSKRRDDEHQQQINRVLDNTSLITKTS